ncbi:TonB family protein [uncultured Methylophaga sp.]|jgi:periplasmic protein TonB|uniref:energy transducer TonB n=1 Tax=uncultured Methylophaga sp. TaxID=285271 RepID=UPI0030DBC243|tara:strand:- start:3203 stop:4027 length:825 start_codon:yes stop_codon:yes gene_type:complete
MTDAGFYDDHFLTPPAENDGVKTSTLLLVGLFHLAMAGLLLNSWTPAQQDEPKLSTIKIQMLRLSKPVPEIKPVEPVPLTIPEPTQPVFDPPPVVQKPEPTPVVQNELAFKRVEEKPIPEKVTPKPIKQKQAEPEKQIVEKTIQQPEKPSKPALAQQTKTTASAAKTPVKQDVIASAEASEPFSVERYKPIEKQAPEYPRGALRKGLEGDCTVRYTVNTQGKVETPEVLENCHPLFKKPSLEAAKTFRYSPRMVNGNAVAVNNILNTFEYRINQ